MLSLVPITFFFICFFVFQKSRATSCWRSSFLSASLVWGLMLTAITEFLSIFRLIGFWEILGLWIISITLALICLIRVNGSARSFNIGVWLASISRFELLLLAGLAIIVIIVGMIGWISPPNNWDSMTYHMSRVVHWIQNRSVAHYPTSFPPQLYEGPWAEFAIMHFQILTGGDRVANLIQWFSLLGTVLGVSLLGSQLGAGLRGQIFAAVFSVTIPMGILQGSTTQTDYVVSFWLVCFVYCAIVLKEHDQIRYSLATGIGLGLSILTKPTAYLYAFPFMVWISLSLVKSRHTRGLLQIILIVTTAVVINLGQYTRNYNLFGSPFGPGYEEVGKKYSNDIFTLSSFTSNVIRNIGLQIGTPFNPVNSFLERGIYKAHRMIGFETNDIRTTWPRTKFYVEPLSLQEDRAGNPLHLVLMIVLIPMLIVQQHQKRDAIWFFVCLVFGFLLFCLYLKWQPSNSRLHLPLFVLWSALIGLSLSQIRAHWIADLCILILLLGAIPYLVYNKARPILGQESIITSNRTELYFRNRPSIAEPYIRSTQFLSNTQCSDIGLILPVDSYEYPFWVLLGKDDRPVVRIEHVNVTNISQVISNEYPFNTFTPCSIIVVSDDPPNEVRIGDVTYLQKWLSDPVSVFMQK